MISFRVIMGFISASGTGCAARIAGLGISTALVIGATQPSSLDVTITGLRNVKGTVMICLTSNSRAFPDCSKDSHSHRLIVAAVKAGNVRFEGLAPGFYAISMIHDENMNGKLDKIMMIPREGFGFSRNPTIMFGPPRFAAAQFRIAEGSTAQAIRMKYIF